MSQLQLVVTGNLGNNRSFPQSVIVNGESDIFRNKSIAAAVPGSVTTHTDNSNGIVTVTVSDPGFANADRIDLFWAGGCRRGMTVSAHGGSGPWTVTLTGGAGDNFPAGTTVVTMGKCISREFLFSGDDLQALIASLDSTGCIVLTIADNTEEWSLVNIVAAAAVKYWYTGSGVTNPLAGLAIAKVFMSNGDSSGAKNAQIGAVVN